MISPRQNSLVRFVRERRRLIALGAAIVIGFAYGVVVGTYKVFPFNAIADLKSLIVSVRTLGNPERMIATSLVKLRMRTFNAINEARLTGTGGAITTVGDQVLGVDASGRFFSYDQGGMIQPVNIAVDTNRRQFADYLAQHVPDSGLRSSTLQYFRTFDLLSYPLASGALAILFSYNYWDTDRAAKFIRVSRLVLETPDNVFAGSQTVDSSEWELIFEAGPPLWFGPHELWVDRAASDHLPIRSFRSGGRMALDGRGHLLIGIGDQKMDGVGENPNGPQDDNSSYGKVVRINLSTLDIEHVAKGVRNPQGLLVDVSGNVWETEHGPQGGDELNLIVDGANFGWPWVTHGTDYARDEWPLNQRQGRHDGYDRAMFAWVPSIGVSNLVQIRNDPPEWDGDLLVSSLGRATLFRLRIRDGRVIFVEPIQVQHRIRDIDQMPDGTIVLWTDDARIVELKGMPRNQENKEFLQVQLTEREAAAGVETVLRSCSRCHAMGEGEVGGSGPSLWGIHGRKLAGTDFAGYSPALRDKGGVWTDGNLKDYLRQPNEFVEGTIMPDPFLNDETTIATLVGYLRRLK